jgi:hypothetical protein
LLRLKKDIEIDGRGENDTSYNPGLLESTIGVLLTCYTFGRSNAFDLSVVENNPH